LQHATAKQLLETDLISQEIWDNYYKFTFVRNPWDRAYSAYLWVMRDCKIKGSFRDFILKKGVFTDVLINQETKRTRSCHIWPQTDFFSIKGEYDLNYVGHFETLQEDIKSINTQLKIEKQFKHHTNKSHKRVKHYSLFYGKTNRKLVESLYSDDIDLLNYSFENKKSNIQLFKDLFK